MKQISSCFDLIFHELYTFAKYSYVCVTMFNHPSSGSLKFIAETCTLIVPSHNISIKKYIYVYNIARFVPCFPLDGLVVYIVHIHGFFSRVEPHPFEYFDWM